MEIQFNGKRALVTGASRGIGRSIALKLSKCGAKVVAVGKSKANLTKLKEEDPSIEIVPLDLSDWKSTRTTLSKLGPIDLLVNNAGIAILGPLIEVTENDVDQLFDLNVKALINCTQIVIKSLLKRKVPGSIVNVSSQTALVGLENHMIYGATKGAVDAFTRAAALEFGPYNIRINCVNPTVIMTDMSKEAWADSVKVERKKSKIPLKRFGEEYEVADAVLFLLSDKSSMITGTSLPVDGGYTAV